MRFLLLLIPLLMAFAPIARADALVLGAERTDVYMPQLEGRRVALLSNHTGILPDGRHTLDVMLEGGIKVVKLFSPEHGFRGHADAGEKVASSVDSLTGLPIVSLYDGSKSARHDVLDDVDVVVCDIQDVGLRYYTYYATMLDLMNAAAAAGKAFMVLDRPNPNGMYVDGPILDMSLRSGVGRLPIPIVHGMTLGELAQMINGMGWLTDGRTVDLTVVPCLGYTHSTRYTLPVPPSPNLRTMGAIYLYPSTCFFEGTAASLGRGTDSPFEMYGHPAYRGASTFTFTPRSMPGAKNPPLLGKKCRGVDLRGKRPDDVIAAGIDLSYIIDAYKHTHLGKRFFTNFFDLLMGRRDVRLMIMDGCTADEIKASWKDDVDDFRRRRAPYLIYPE